MENGNDGTSAHDGAPSQRDTTSEPPHDPIFGAYGAAG